jgi:hypothetical protein
MIGTYPEEVVARPQLILLQDDIDLLGEGGRIESRGLRSVKGDAV